MIRSLHHCSVTTDISHGGESIKDLSSGDSWHAVHAKSSHLLVSQGLDKVRVLTRVQEGIKNTLFPASKNLKTIMGMGILEKLPEKINLL